MVTLLVTTTRSSSGPRVNAASSHHLHIFIMGKRRVTLHICNVRKSCRTISHRRKLHVKNRKARITSQHVQQHHHILHNILDECPCVATGTSNNMITYVQMCVILL
jgi:hypothetical protein